MTGGFNGSVELKFPLLNDILMKDVDIKVGGTLSDIASSKLVEGIDITDGQLKLDLDHAGFGLQGTASIDKIPLHVNWQEAFAESADRPLKQATVTGTLNGEDFKPFGIDCLVECAGTDAPILADGSKE